MDWETFITMYAQQFALLLQTVEASAEMLKQLGNTRTSDSREYLEELDRALATIPNWVIERRVWTIERGERP